MSLIQLEKTRFLITPHWLRIGRKLGFTCPIWLCCSQNTFVFHYAMMFPTTTYTVVSLTFSVFRNQKLFKFEVPPVCIITVIVFTTLFAPMHICVAFKFDEKGFNFRIFFHALSHCASQSVSLGKRIFLVKCIVSQRKILYCKHCLSSGNTFLKNYPTRK